jgi:hypothetical protein
MCRWWSTLMVMPGGVMIIPGGEADADPAALSPPNNRLDKRPMRQNRRSDVLL